MNLIYCKIGDQRVYLKDYDGVLPRIGETVELRGTTTSPNPAKTSFWNIFNIFQSDDSFLNSLFIYHPKLCKGKVIDLVYSNDHFPSVDIVLDGEIIDLS